MRRRRRIGKLFILPPVILAALFIWLLAGQAASAGSGVKSFGSMRGEPEKSGPASSVLRIQADTGGPASGAGDGTGEGEALTGRETPEEEPVTLLFGGDIYFSDHVMNAYRKAGGIAGVLDQNLLAAAKAADIFMANEEFPFSSRGTPAPDKEFTFRVAPEKVTILQEIGTDIVTLANNHVLDYGTDALLDTCAVLNQAGIYYVGAGGNLEEAKRLAVLEAGGLRIGFLAASRVMPVASWAAGKSRPGVFPTYDPGLLLEEIQAAGDQCDYLVVYVHWGIERETVPKDYQRALGRQYIDAGADLVVGSHPHVLQGIEYYKGKPIVYSLANFVFGSSIPKTALLRVELTGASRRGGDVPGTDASGAEVSGAQESLAGTAGAKEPEAGSPGARLSLLPCTSSAGYTRTLEPEKWADFFRYMEGLSFGVLIGEDGTVAGLEQ